MAALASFRPPKLDFLPPKVPENELTEATHMDQDTEESLRAEIRDIKAVPYAERSTEDKRRLNDLEAEIRRRHPELLPQQPVGKPRFNIILSCTTLCLTMFLLFSDRSLFFTPSFRRFLVFVRWVRCRDCR